jgi:hypothetical protein
MTCAVEFIIDSSENVLLVPNAALRYQPLNLNSEQISDMVFNASLANMNEEQRVAAIEARAVARSSGGQAQNTPTLTTLMMGPQQSQRAMGGGGGRRQTEQQGAGRNANVVVMRTLWFINNDGRLDVIQVRTGISDGSFTQVFLDDEFEGKQVILRERL